MKKIIILINLVFLTIFGTAAAHEVEANVAAQNIINLSIKNLKDLYSNNQEITLDDINKLVYKEFIPFVDIDFSAQQTLKKYWKDLDNNQKRKIEQYIINSLVNDYASFLINYKGIDSIKITAAKDFKKKDNLAIVKIVVQQKEAAAREIAVKMIKTNIWRIYDVVISGVSVVKNYEQQFESHIKYQGFDSFEKKFLN